MIEEIYAKSLIELGADLLKPLKQIREVFENSEDLRNVLSNPGINFSNKKDILNSVFGGKIDEKLINFLKILCEKNRIEEFSNVVAAYEAELDKRNNIKFVEIISAIELNDSYKQKIINKLSEKLKAAIHPQWIVNSDIIGGLVFKFEDTVVDSSLKKKIENFSKIMK